MSNPSQHPQNIDCSNNDELDQKNNNNDGPPDLNEIKLTIKDDDQQRIFASNSNQFSTSNDNRPLHVHDEISNSPTNSQIINSRSNSSILINSNTETTLCNSVTAENLNNNPNSNVNNSTTASDQQSLPPAYWEVPGTVPLGAGTNGPPPSYDEVINPNVPPPTYHSLFGQIQSARKSSKTLPDLIRKLIIILLGTIGLAILISFTVLIPFTMILVGVSNLDNCPAEKIPLFLLIGGITWLAKNLSNFFTQCSSRRTNRSTNSSSTNSNNNNSTANNNSSNPCASRFSNNTCTAESNPCRSNSSGTNRSSRCVINLDNEQSAIELQHIKNRRRDFLINCFITAWFITGCCMVYRIYPPNYTDPTNPNFCNKTVYFYSFWLLTSTFVIFALFIGCICCVSLTSLISSNSEIRI